MSKSKIVQSIALLVIGFLVVAIAVDAYFLIKAERLTETICHRFCQAANKEKTAEKASTAGSMTLLNIKNTAYIHTPMIFEFDYDKERSMMHCKSGLICTPPFNLPIRGLDNHVFLYEEYVPIQK